MSAALHVGNLPYDVSPSELRAWFEQCGEVKEVRLVESGEAGRTRGFAVVIMSLESSAALAIRRLDGSILEGRALSVTRMEGRPLTSSGTPLRDRPATIEAPRHAPDRPAEAPRHAPDRPAKPADSAQDRSAVRMQQQFRERGNMTYELDCSGTPLVIRVFFPAEDGPAAHWRVEAHTLPGAPVSSALGTSRAGALESLARSWHDQDAARAPSKLDWDAVARAMASVRAI